MTKKFTAYFIWILCLIKKLPGRAWIKKNILFVCVICLSGLLLLGRLAPGHDWGGDFAGYIMQAKSIVELAPVAYIDSNRVTIEQSTIRGLGPVAYPWGYPLLLAPLYAVFDLDILALKAIGILSFILFLFVIWFAFRKDHSTPWLLCLLSFFAFNPYLLSFTASHIWSDIPFLLFSTICISAIRTIIVEERCVISQRADLVLLGACMAAAFAVRSNGILLLLTLAISCCLHCFQVRSSRRHFPKNNSNISLIFHSFFSSSALPGIKFLIPFLVFACLIIILRLLLPSGGTSHLIHFKFTSIDIIRNNLFYYFNLPSDFFLHSPLRSVIYGATIPLAIVGVTRRYRKDYPAIIYIVFTFFLFILWPHRQGFRFIFPVLPFYISFVCTGLECFTEGSRGVARVVKVMFAWLPVAFILYFFMLNNISVFRHNAHSIFTGNENLKIQNGPFSQQSIEMFSFIANHTDSNDVIVFFKPRVMKLMTERQSVLISQVDQIYRGDFICLIHSTNLFQLSMKNIDSLLTEGKLYTVFENNGFSCYVPGLNFDKKAILSLPSSAGIVENGIRKTNNNSGFLVYGPYSPLKAGSYRLNIYGSSEVVSGSYVDVVSDKGKRLYTRLNLKRDDEGVLLRDAAIQLPSDVSDIEVRIWVNERDELKLFGYSLKPFSGDNSGQNHTLPKTIDVLP